MKNFVSCLMLTVFFSQIICPVAYSRPTEPLIDKYKNLIQEIQNDHLWHKYPLSLEAFEEWNPTPEGEEFFNAVYQNIQLLKQKPVEDEYAMKVGELSEKIQDYIKQKRTLRFAKDQARQPGIDYSFIAAVAFVGLIFGFIFAPSAYLTCSTDGTFNGKLLCASYLLLIGACPLSASGGAYLVSRLIYQRDLNRLQSLTDDLDGKKLEFKEYIAGLEQQKETTGFPGLRETMRYLKNLTRRGVIRVNQDLDSASPFASSSSIDLSPDSDSNSESDSRELVGRIAIPDLENQAELLLN